MKDELISAVLHLLLKSKTHFNYPLWVIEKNVLRSINVGSYRVYIDKGSVIGFINWTFLNASEIESVIKSHGVMNSGLWRSKPTSETSLYIPELVASDNIYRLIHLDIQSLFPECSIAYGLSWKRANSEDMPRLRRLKRM